MLYELVDIDKTKPLDSDDLQEIASKLENELNETKNEIKRILEVKYEYSSDFKPLMSKCEKYEKQIDFLNNQINLVKNEIKEKQSLIENSHDIDEYKHLIEKIEAFNNAIKLLELLQMFDNDLNEFTGAIESNNYSKCYDYLIKLEKLIEDNFKSDAELTVNNHIYMIRNLKDEFFIQKQHFYYNIEQLLDTKFINVDTSTPKVCVINVDKKLLEATLKHLEKFFTNNRYETLLSMFKKKFTILSKNLLNVFESMNRYRRVTAATIENHQQLRIELENECTSSSSRSTSSSDGDDDDDGSSGNDDDENLSQIKQKFAIIQKVIEYLNEQLFELDLKFRVVNTPLSQVFKIEFKKLFLDDFFKFIYENLILKSIKLTEFNMKKMLNLCTVIDRFEQFLCEKRIQFLSGNSDYEVLLFKSFKLNIDNIYITKKCKYLLNKARRCMKLKTDLFETCLVSNDETATVSVELQGEDFKLSPSSESSGSFLKFNKCKISELTSKLIRIVYETLTEAVKFEQINEDNCKNDDELSIKLIRNVSLLCLTAKNIIDLYSYVMPVYYKDEYQNLPLMAAIGFNDFQYMSHHCLTITHQYKPLLSKLTDTSIQTFIDLVPKLRAISYRLINEHISAQERLLEDYLTTNNNGLANISESNSYSLFEKCLSRCQMQLVNLSNLWLKILNKQVYLQIFGKFFNLICRNLVDSILKLDDISADDASYLNKLLNIIRLAVVKIFGQQHRDDDVESLTSSPGSPIEGLGLDEKHQQVESMDKLTINLTKIDLEASKFINLWIKYKYLCFILNAHLVDIVDLWAHSKGPLALYFTKDEIRHLIKALFMVTDKRTAALAEIN